MEATKNTSVLSRWPVGAIKPIKRSRKPVCSQLDRRLECAFKAFMAELTAKIDAVHATYNPTSCRGANPLQNAGRLNQWVASQPERNGASHVCIS
jgi:hypothetical protein